jgi:hypothetical protein
MLRSKGRDRLILISGDIILFALVTIIGFASHGTAGTAGSRMFTTFFPLVAAWFMVAPFLKVYDRSRVLDWHELWRPFWSMVIAAPLAAWMRGMLLGTPILPVFVIVLGGISAIGITLWRALYILILVKFQSGDG